MPDTSAITVAVISVAGGAVLGFGTSRINVVLEHRRQDEGVRSQVRSMLTEVVLIIASSPAIYGSNLTDKQSDFIETFLKRVYESDVSVAFDSRQLGLVYRASTSLRNFLNVSQHLADVQHASDLKRSNAWGTLTALFGIMTEVGLESDAEQIARRTDTAIEDLAGPQEPPEPQEDPFPNFVKFLERFKKIPKTKAPRHFWFWKQQ